MLERAPAIGYVEEHPTPEIFEAAVRMDLEGIVAKRKTDPYGANVEWIKVKRSITEIPAVQPEEIEGCLLRSFRGGTLARRTRGRVRP